MVQDAQGPLGTPSVDFIGINTTSFLYDPPQ
jgi:hypothetical protein